MLTIVGSIVSTGNIQFENELYVYMSSKITEESGYSLDLDLLIIMFQSHVHILWEMGELGKVAI